MRNVPRRTRTVGFSASRLSRIRLQRTGDWLLINLCEPPERAVPGLLHVIREYARRELVVPQVILQALAAIALSGTPGVGAVAETRVALDIGARHLSPRPPSSTTSSNDCSRPWRSRQGLERACWTCRFLTCNMRAYRVSSVALNFIPSINLPMLGRWVFSGEINLWQP